MAVSVTIDDVAAHAGVSIKTVSRVVNREANVSEKTRNKVMAAIEALNYRPNQAARGLAGRRSYLIGVVYDNISPNYLINLQSGMIETCHAASYGLALCPVAYAETGLVEHVMAWVRHSQVDGVLLTPPLTDCAPLLVALEKAGVPVVLVSSLGAGQVPAVVIDEVEAARQMTLHLIALGHTEIGFIKGPAAHSASQSRYEGFKAALAGAGIAINGAYVVEGRFDFDSGEIAAQRLLKGKRPTAIFASNDDMAAGVLHAAHKLGIAIPEALAVVGFDDTPISRQVWPSLTTIRQPIREMGNHAADLLLQLIAKKVLVEDGSSMVFQHGFELKVRGSSQKTSI
ncbi:LacI family DNA-binding transcriptional regulator [Kordiimonas pumila]|uniref:LacI family DNA-binding transcriptional regulator n=1 Tax=Kordiimonas pumila TaxID=2161677 RepID=A0ABV7D8J1_9PROT|nr:LacI family DNA-binding transcriptional regulator [Kordiimonas pumila]